MSAPVPTLEQKIQFLDDFMIPSFDDEKCPNQTVKGRKLWIRNVRSTQKTLPAEPLLDELFGLYGRATEQQLQDNKLLLLRLLPADPVKFTSPGAATSVEADFNAKLHIDATDQQHLHDPPQQPTVLPPPVRELENWYSDRDDVMTVTVFRCEQLKVNPDESIMMVPCFPGIWPVDKASFFEDHEIRTVSIALNSKFKDIFNHVVAMYEQETKLPVKRALIQGSPGSSKSLGSLVALLHLVCKHNIQVLYVPFKAGMDSEPRQCATILTANGMLYVVSVRMEAGRNRAAMVEDYIRKKHPPCVFLDGVTDALKYEAKGYYSILRSTTEKAFMGITSSAVSTDHLMHILNIRRDTVLRTTPWEMSDYHEAIDNGLDLRGRLELLGLRDDQYEDKQAIKKSIETKYALAGASARFMFDYSDKEVVSTLKIACVKQRGDRTVTEADSNTAHTLWIQKGSHLVPVSLAACWLLVFHGVLKHESLWCCRYADVIRKCNGNLAMVGWMFEMEVVTRLTYLVKPPSTSSAPRLSLFDIPFVNFRTPIAFNLLKSTLNNEPAASEYADTVNNGAAYHHRLLPDPIPDSFVEQFTNNKDLVSQITKEFMNTKTPGQQMWFFPKNYCNPFFDALLCVVTAERVLVMRTLQITVSSKHSFKAKVMQLLSNGLFRNDITVKWVMHHAVLDEDKVFAFENKDCAILRRSPRLAEMEAKEAAAASAARTVVDVDLNNEEAKKALTGGVLLEIAAKKRKLDMDKCFDDHKEDDEAADVTEEELEEELSSANLKFHGTTVYEGVTYSLVDSFTRLSSHFELDLTDETALILPHVQTRTASNSSKI